MLQEENKSLKTYLERREVYYDHRFLDLERRLAERTLKEAAGDTGIIDGDGDGQENFDDADSEAEEEKPLQGKGKNKEDDESVQASKDTKIKVSIQDISAQASN